MFILGIDPGSQRCGWALLRIAPGAVAESHSGVIKAGNGITGERLEVIYTNLVDAFTRWQIDHVAVEGPFVNSKNPRGHAVLDYVRGLVHLVAAQHDVPVTEYAPATIKATVGQHGRAKKDAIQRAVHGLLHIPEDRLISEDEADALAIGWTHCVKAGLIERWW